MIRVTVTFRTIAYLFQCTAANVVCLNGRHSITCASGLNANRMQDKVKLMISYR